MGMLFTCPVTILTSKVANRSSHSVENTHSTIIDGGYGWQELGGVLIWICSLRSSTATERDCFKAGGLRMVAELGAEDNMQLKCTE